MAQCQVCRSMFPPGFVEGEKCIFCVRDTDMIKYGDGKSVTKLEIIKEYDIFMKMVKEKNEILKRAVKGDFTGIPDKLILD